MRQYANKKYQNAAKQINSALIPNAKLFDRKGRTIKIKIKKGSKGRKEKPNKT
jgi:hypothetical protein